MGVHYFGCPRRLRGPRPRRRPTRHWWESRAPRYHSTLRADADAANPRARRRSITTSSTRLVELSLRSTNAPQRSETTAESSRGMAGQKIMTKSIIFHNILEFWAFQGYKGMGEERQRLNRKNLPRSPPPLPPTNNLFGSLPKLDVAHTTGEVQSAEGLVHIIGHGRDAAEHERLAILRDTILQ